MRIFAVIAVLSLILACRKQREAEVLVSQTDAIEPATAGLVPLVTISRLNVWEVGRFTPIDGKRLGMAVLFILTLERSPRLNQPKDHEIMALLRDYVEQRRTFFYSTGSAHDRDGRFGIAGYNCEADQYIFTPEIAPSTVVLALTLYHEVGHAARCDRLLAQGLTRKDAFRQLMAMEPCVAESESFAAEARLLAAILDRAGRVPLPISATEALDQKVLQSDLDAWQALSANRFCAWYRQAR